jgi:ADP-ribose pyrophosphatase
MAPSIWQVLARRRVLDASPWLQVFRETVKISDGRVVDDYYTIDIPDFVVIAAFDKQGQIIAERLYKHGVRRIVLQLPAGGIDVNENAIAAAQRELLEETGYGEGTWQGLGKFAICGTRGCGHAHLFLARDVERVMDPIKNDLEEIEVVTMPPNMFRDAIFAEQVAEFAIVSAFLLAYQVQQST